jgi:hypothetical protein
VTQRRSAEPALSSRRNPDADLRTGFCKGAANLNGVARLRIIERDDEQYLALEVEPVDRFRKSLGETFESIKLGLVKRFRELPNPATYLATSSLALPLQETLLPVAKRRLMRELASA